MQKKVLKKLQDAELEILDEIVKICEKYNLNYFLSYGTLLGAIRHQGYIPWDDDIDLHMPYEDYEKFLKIAPQEINPKYQIINSAIDSKFYLQATKVMNKKTIYIEKRAKNYEGHVGIWVDIFPLYRIKKNSKWLKLKTYLIYALNGGLANKNLKLTPNFKSAKLLVKFLKLIPNKLLIKSMQLLSYNHKKGSYYISYTDLLPSEYENFIFKEDDIFPLKKIKFENKEYLVPDKCDNILTQLYGDYMQLPPVEKRVNHNPLKVVFEDGETYTFDSEND